MTNTNYETLQKEATIFAKEIYARLDLMTKSDNPIVELNYEGINIENTKTIQR